MEKIMCVSYSYHYECFGDSYSDTTDEEVTPEEIDNEFTFAHEDITDDYFDIVIPKGSYYKKISWDDSSGGCEGWHIESSSEVLNIVYPVGYTP